MLCLGLDALCDEVGLILEGWFTDCGVLVCVYTQICVDVMMIVELVIRCCRLLSLRCRCF